MLTSNGHDCSGTTANRPTNAETGQLYFDTDLGILICYNAGTSLWVPSANATANPGAAGTSGTGGAGGALAQTGGAGGAVTTGTGGAGGAVNDVGGVGGAATGAAGAGGVGGATAQTGGAGGAVSSATGGAAGAGGAGSVIGGVGGATAVTTGGTGGAGGGVLLTAGAGGAASAGTSNGGAGGNVTIAPGAGGASAGGTAGAVGTISLAGPVSSPVTSAQTIANGNTITLPTSGKNKLLTNAGAVTGILMTAGVYDGQEVELLNNTANSVTFAAVGTSLVADGASAVIAANTRMRLVYSTTALKWFHGN